MRLVPCLLGFIWFALCTTASYRQYARIYSPPRLELRRAPAPVPVARPLPAATPGPAAVPAPAREALPAAVSPAGRHGEPYPSPGVTPAPIPVPVSTSPPVSAPQPRVPAPALLQPAPALPAPAVAAAATSRKWTASTRQKSTAKSPALPEAIADLGGVCLVCGGRADSWVENEDRQRIGYCRRHLDKVVRPEKPARSSAQREAAAPPEAEPAAGTAPGAAEGMPAGAAETGSHQCRGVTKSGQPCRRKTRDPSGFCYQHRPAAGSAGP